MGPNTARLQTQGSDASGSEPPACSNYLYAFPSTHRQSSSFGRERAAWVRALSDRLLDTVRPVRVLQSLAWRRQVEEEFFAAGANQLPPVTSASYPSLCFEPDRKRAELRALANDARRRLGRHPAGVILHRLCREYVEVIDLLAHRGTPAAAGFPGQLYGRASDRCGAGGPRLASAARALADASENISDASDQPGLQAIEAAAVLSDRLSAYFGGPGLVHAIVVPGMIADASASGGMLRLRADARFSCREVRLLEVHEGWVHVGTTRNARLQPFCTFLRLAAPSSTATQEGLAVLTEVLAGASYPARMARLAQRVVAIAMAEDGADFLDVYRYFLGKGCPPRESYRQAARVFRGVPPAGPGAFTKDICYFKGLLELVSLLRDGGGACTLGALLCGKARLEDLPYLEALAEEGLLAPPAQLPGPIANLPLPAASLSPFGPVT